MAFGDDTIDPRVLLKIGDLHAKAGLKQLAIEAYLKVARLYVEEHSWTKALAVYKQILKLDPELVDVRLRIAALYRDLGIPERD